jgi:hypothetical protein
MIPFSEVDVETKKIIIPFWLFTELVVDPQYEYRWVLGVTTCCGEVLNDHNTASGSPFARAVWGQIDPDLLDKELTREELIALLSSHVKPHRTSDGYLIVPAVFLAIGC